MTTSYRVARLAKYRFSTKFSVVDDTDTQVTPRTFSSYATAQRIADQLTAGQIQPDPQGVVEIAADETDIEVATATIADARGFQERRGGMTRSSLGGGYDTQIWDD